MLEGQMFPQALNLTHGRFTALSEEFTVFATPRRHPHRNLRVAYQQEMNSGGILGSLRRARVWTGSGERRDPADKVCLCLAGESGLGKSTLINSLFLTDLYSAEYPGPSHRIKKTVQVRAQIGACASRPRRLQVTEPSDCPD